MNPVKALNLMMFTIRVLKGFYLSKSPYFWSNWHFQHDEKVPKQETMVTFIFTERFNSIFQIKLKSVKYIIKIEQLEKN